jgi:hypothetical protein
MDGSHLRSTYLGGYCSCCGPKRRESRTRSAIRPPSLRSSLANTCAYAFSSLFRSTRCHAKDRRIAIHNDGANKSDTLSTSTEYEGEHSPARIHHGICRQAMLGSCRPGFRIAKQTHTRRDVNVVYRIGLKHQVFDQARQLPPPRYYIRHEDTISPWNVIGYLRNRWSGV